MKIAFYTDMHWSGNWPKRRKDNFTETVERKHKFIYKDAEYRGCDIVLNAGDINETPIVANSIINRQLNILREKSIEEFGIYGNHDVIGNNAEKAEQVSASILFSSGLMEKLSKDEPTVVTRGDINIMIYGIDVHKDMDNLRPEDYYVKKPDWIDFCILVAHGWLTDREINIEGLKHTTFDSVLKTGTEADIIYTGHYHPGHGTVMKFKENGKPILFHNPGSAVRIKASKGEMERQVGYSITTLEKGEEPKIEFIPFPELIARPAAEVLDRESLEADIAQQEKIEFIEHKYSDILIKATSPREVIMEIAKESKISEHSKQDLIRRIDEANQELENDKLSYEI